MITVTHDLASIQVDLKAAPQKLQTALHETVQRIAQMFARAQRREAPENDGVLRNSLKATKVADGEWFAGTSMNYAGYLIKGTGRGGLVPLQNMIEWIKRKRIVSRTPGVDQKQLAMMMQKSILAKGIKQNDFAKRAYDIELPKVDQIIRERLEQLRLMGNQPS